MGISQFAFVSLLFSGLAMAMDTLPSGCQFDQECTVEVPGSLCADGTSSYYTLTPRRGAKKLLIYMAGGGACWDKGSCKAGLAKPLTRVEPNNDWNTGSGIRDASDSENPFASGYDVATIPYCTGDVFVGNRTIDYGTRNNPMVIHHQGFRNVELFYASIQKQIEAPEKVVNLGCSAGGIGAIYHMRTLATAYPNAQKYVISDAGTPFSRPFLPQGKMHEIIYNWGADSTLPQGTASRSIEDFGDVVFHNGQTFPKIRFGFISSYRDGVMTFFGAMVGATDPMTFVQNTIIQVANRDIGPAAADQKVFYVDSNKHCHTGDALGTNSLGVRLNEWMSDMLNDSPNWQNVRPDLTRRIRKAVVPTRLPVEF